MEKRERIIGFRMSNHDSVIKARKAMAKESGISEEQAGINLTEESENHKRIHLQCLGIILDECKSDSRMVQYIPSLSSCIFQAGFKLFFKLTEDSELLHSDQIELLDKIQEEINKFLDKKREDLKKGDEQW